MDLRKEKVGASPLVESLDTFLANQESIAPGRGDTVSLSHKMIVFNAMQDVWSKNQKNQKNSLINGNFKIYILKKPLPPGRAFFLFVVEVVIFVGGFAGQVDTQLAQDTFVYRGK